MGGEIYTNVKSKFLARFEWCACKITSLKADGDNASEGRRKGRH